MPPDAPEDADMSLSPASTKASSSNSVDPLVADTTRKLAEVINHFKRQLDQRDGTWVNVTGALELALPSQTFDLTIVADEAGEEFPITVQAKAREPDAANKDPSTNVLPTNYKPTRRASDTELEKELVSRKKRRLDDSDDDSDKRSRNEDADEDVMPLITKEDLDDLLVKLREDIQEDTSECVNHVQRLLRRFKEEWHDKSQWDYERAQSMQGRQSLQKSVPTNGAASRVAFPSPGTDREDPNTSTSDVVRQEAKLLSSQIKWVEECRRVAADIHDQKEEIWRTSSAGFHDRQRQDREGFQHRMLHESGLHAQTLTHILNEVKAIGLYAQSMKWETPNSHLAYHPPVIPTPPAFPTQPTPAPSASSPAGRGRGQTPVRHPSQR
ncbi:hypothetical protein ACN47E_001372 [Coniothyrium glycines]